jgi:hypothetical protein
VLPYYINISDDFEDKKKKIYRKLLEMIMLYVGQRKWNIIS